MKPELGFCLLLFSIFLPFRIPLGSTSIACTWLVIFILFYFYLVKGFARGFYKFPIKVLIPFIVFTVFGFLSLLNAVDVAYSVNKLILWLLAVALLIIVIDNASKSKREIEKYINLLFYASIVCGIAGIFIIILGMIFGSKTVVTFIFSEVYPIIRSEEDVVFHQAMVTTRAPLLNWTVMHGTVLRNISLFLTPIATGSFFGMVASIALGFYLNLKKNKWHLFIFLFAVLNIALTQARGVWIGMVISLGLIFIINKGIKKKVQVVFMLALIGVVLFCSAGDVFLSRMSAMSYDTSILARLDFLRHGIRIAVENSLTGIGFANYEAYVDTIIHEYPHNQFVEIWAETGLGGLIAYLFILISLLQRNYRSMRNAIKPFDKGLYTGAIGSIVFFIIHSIFEDLLTAPPVILTFLIIMGIAEANRIVSKKIQLCNERVSR